ncbi:conserved hypothethical protein (plasmid) [Ralstonia solanacearum CMR15]|nr:conserved hypothethical protein [Ralstonia solanacearum CMR15]
MRFLTRFFSPPTTHEYATLFMNKLRELGDTRTWQYDAPQNRLIVPPTDGKPSGDVVNLGNMYGEYRAAGRRERAEALRRQAAGMMQRYIPDAFAEARAHLLPIVRLSTERGQAYLQLGVPEDKRDIAFRPLCDNLEIGLAYDSEYSISRLNEARLRDWGVTFDEAYAVALDHLRERSGQAWKALDNGVFVSQFGDLYDASRLLLTDLLHRQPISGMPVVMIPSRAVLLLTGDRNDAGLATLVALAEAVLEDPRPLSSRMLRWTGEHWEIFVPPTLANRLALLHAKESVGDYGAQKTMLDEAHAQQGIDIFVATYQAHQGPDGTVVSSCVWSEDVHALLPVTDEMFLHRASTGHVVKLPWERAQQACGHLMAMTPHAPARYEVKAFPPPDLYDALLAEFGNASAPQN